MIERLREAIMNAGGDMPLKESGLVEFLLDWWQFFAFVAGGVLAIITMKERNRYRVSDLAKKVDHLDADLREMKADLREMKSQGNTEAVALAEIATMQRVIVADLTWIKKQLDGKADK